MAYRFGQYTQPLMLQRQLGQAATTGSLLEDLRTRNLRKTKSEYASDVNEQMRAREQRAARKAESIGKKFGILKTVANFIPGGQFLKPVLSGLEARESGKAFSKSGKGLGKYKDTFMGERTEAFAEGQKNLAKSFDPFQALMTSAIEEMVTSKAKHEVPGTDIASTLPENLQGSAFEQAITSGPLAGTNIEKMWKDMSIQERLGSIFPGGGIKGDDNILSGITRATTAFSPYLNRPKYTTSFYGG